MMRRSIVPSAPMSIVTRFAPSPTGYLHLGHASVALAAWTRARAGRGRFLLRLEDIDPTRCRPAYADAILEDLAWLGLDWDGPVRVQSAHLGDYRAVLDTLTGRGLLYPCTCTRADIARAGEAPHGPDGPIYPGTCRDVSPQERAARASQPHALRLDMAKAIAAAGPLSLTTEDGGRVACHPARFGDVVLARRDAPASYHLCVTHDDALQAVTLVTRGADLAAVTDIHRLVQTLMEWPEPVYCHLPIKTDAAGRRLSKRDGAATLRALRHAGMSAREVRILAATS